MAKCKKCGEKYFSKTCLKCENSHLKFNETQPKIKTFNNAKLSEKEKLYKILRYSIMFIFFIMVISSIIEIYMANKIVEGYQPIFKSMNDLSKTMDKATQKILNP